MVWGGRMSDDVWSWLDSLKAFGYNPSLENTSTLLERLDLPQNTFPAVHIAGSNGKGTCCAILANAFTLSGKCTGLFTSPHLSHVNERVRIDGSPISSDLFEDCLKQIQEVCKTKPEVSPTFYEATFLVAMLAFRNQGVDRAVIETGLGGRWDATRLVNADCCILTKISLEHTDVLGDSLEQIAREKAAIVRPNYPIVVLENSSEEVNRAITETVHSSSQISWVDDNYRDYYDTAKELAKSALDAMNLPHISEIIDSAALKTIWPGRNELIHLESNEIYDGNIHLILDGAHNPDGMKTVLNNLYDKMHPDVILFGCTQQSNLQDFLEPLIEFIQYSEVKKLIITEPVGGRQSPVPASEIFDTIDSSNQNKNWFAEFRIDGIEVIPNIRQAFEKAKKFAFNINQERYPVLFCTGSLYLIGKIRELSGKDPGVILGD